MKDSRHLEKQQKGKERMRTPIQPSRPNIRLPELIAHTVYNVVFAVIFGVFAMGYDSDPDDCIA